MHFVRSASTGRILNGAKPADLPVCSHQVRGWSSTQDIDLTVPPSLLARSADG
jgi:hypothetical protein